MKSVFERLWSACFGRARSKHVVPLAADSERRKNPAGASAHDAAPSSVLAAIGARRPLISGEGVVVGFEFRLGDAVQRRLKRRSDQQGQAAYVAALLTSARLVAQTGRIGLARVPAAWLQHAAGDAAGTGSWIALEQAPQTTLDATQVDGAIQASGRLRAAGAKVGWQIASDLGPAPDFVLLRQGSDPIAALLGSMQTWPAALRALPAVATDIATAEDLEAALQGGISHVCGTLAAAAGPPDPTRMASVRPEALRVGQLLNQIVNDVDTALIVGKIKGDVGLSYGLLRLIGGARFAQWNTGADIDKAVAMLGRNELYRWLSVMLMQFAGVRKVSPALRETALWRARLLELLALERREPAPGQLFTLGLASALGQILNVSVADVVSTLHLAGNARQALLEQAGPWHPYLQLALQLDTPDPEAAEVLANPFGGRARVLELSEQAWAWAAEHTDRAGPAAAGGG